MRSISALEALAAARDNRHGRWKNAEDSASERLSRRICVPHNAPSFEIGSDDKIFAIGSCFARNVEERLAAHHSGVLSLTIDLAGAETTSGRATGIVNKFNALSMLQEFEWASGQKACPDDAYLQAKSGLYYDPHIRRKISDASIDELRSRRRLIGEYFSRAFSADLVIVTLGLAEVWLDNKTGLALNEMPDYPSVRREPDRFVFGMLSVEENRMALDAMHKIISEHGKPNARMLVTVSPVPLGRTFTAEDVIVANMHAKSALRVAAAEFAASHGNVDYFPSYESAMLSDRSLAWADDQLHVSDFMVGRIIETFLKRYGVAIAKEEPESDAEEKSSAEADLIRQLRREVDRYKTRLVAAERSRNI